MNRFDEYHKDIKQISQKIYFSDGTSITIVDYKPKHYLDDIMYQKSNDIWTILPRGLSYAIIDDIIVGQVFANPKFGNINDPYHSKIDETQPVHFVMLEKSNGEAMHLSAFRYNNQNYIFGGSKLVHLVLRCGIEEEDLQLYSSQRYAIAISMMKCFLSLSEEVRNQTIDYLVRTGETFIGENIDILHQHMVHYKNNTIQWFAINKERNPNFDGLLEHRPDRANEIFTRLGLESVPIIGSGSDEDLLKIYNDTCFRKNSEGGVCYAIQDDKVVKIYKVKNIMYIMMRATRELLKKNANNEQFNRRFFSIKEALPLYVSEDFINSRIDICFKFFNWYDRSRYSFDQYATAWQEFLSAFSKIKL